MLKQKEGKSHRARTRKSDVFDILRDVMEMSIPVRPDLPQEDGHQTKARRSQWFSVPPRTQLLTIGPGMLILGKCFRTLSQI